jgi:anti-anti-sigma factor
MAMELTIERDGSAVTAKVNGRIDSTNARDFEEAIRTKIEDGDHAVIMDFEKLSYISSAGLRAVLMTAKTLWKRDAKFALCSLSGPVKEVFEISGFDKIIPIHDSREGAINAFEG